MDAIAPAQLGFCAFVIIGAFAVRSTAGFGSAAVAVPLAALVLPLHTVIPVVAGLQLVATIDHGARNWRRVAWTELLRMAPYMVTGLLIGLYLFQRLDSELIRKGLGAFVIGYAVFVMSGAGNVPSEPRRLPWPLSALLNTAGALAGALFGGAASPFHAAYLNALRLSRDAFRATMTTIVLAQVVVRIAGYTSFGLFDVSVLLILACALPCMFMGARLGDVIASRIDPATFTRFLGGVLLLSGALLVWK